MKQTDVRLIDPFIVHSGTLLVTVLEKPVDGSNGIL